MLATALTDLWYGFGVALEPHNLMWCFVGVLVGNMVGVLPGMGALAAISILLPLTFGMQPVGAILMLAGIFYGAQYGGAICSILLNLPCHPPHAVTCLDGFPLTKQGKGGAALGITMIALVLRRVVRHHRDDLPRAAAGEGRAAVRPGRDLLADAARPARRLDAGARLAAQGRRDDACSACCSASSAPTSRPARRASRSASSSCPTASSWSALALGLFGIAEFLRSVNQYSRRSTRAIPRSGCATCGRARDELKPAFPPMLRGTIVGRLCALIPGTGPTIASFIAYAAEKKISKTPERFGTRRDRRRRQPGGLDAFLGAGRLHPDDEPRHSRRRRDGAACSAR